MIRILENRFTRNWCVTLLHWTMMVITHASCANALFSQGQGSPLSLPVVSILKTKLERDCGLFKEQTPLSDVIHELEKVYGLRIWIDRRIDPNKKITLKTNQETLERVLERIGEISDSELAWMEGVAYLAPRGKGSICEAAYWRLYQAWPTKELDAKPSSLSWEDVTEPSEILQQLASQATWRFENLDMLEHDLWSQGTLDSCSTPAKISILLAGFGMEAKREGNRLTLIPASNETVVLGRTTQWKVEASHFREWKKKWPDVKTKNGKGNDWIIQGPPKAHRELLLVTRASSPTKGNKKVLAFTGSLKGPVGELLGQLAETQGLTVVPWPLPPDRHNQVVEVKVENATLEELLGNIGKAAGLGIKRKGDRVDVDLP